MGANYSKATMGGELSVEKVREEFRELQKAYRYDYGHAGYTGTFAEADGVEFPPTAEYPCLQSTPFDNVASAEKFVEHGADKWGPALAVRYKDKESKERWYVGAWCSE